jgi:hypothetical protein
MKQVKLFTVTALSVLFLFACGKDTVNTKTPDVSQKDVLEGKKTCAQWVQKFNYAPAEDVIEKLKTGNFEGKVDYLRNDEAPILKINGITSRVDLFLTKDNTYVLKVVELLNERMTAKGRAGDRQTVVQTGNIEVDEKGKTVKLLPDIATIKWIDNHEDRVTITFLRDVAAGGFDVKGIKDMAITLMKTSNKAPEVSVETMKKDGTKLYSKNGVDLEL